MSENRIKVGSLENKEGIFGNIGNEAIKKGISAGNININTSKDSGIAQYSAKTIAAKEKQDEIIRSVEAERRVKRLVIPTNEDEIKAALRSIGEPITLFGESAGDRSNRLRRSLVSLNITDLDQSQIKAAMCQRTERQEVEVDNSKEFFYPAKPELIEARKRICEYTFQAAPKRLKEAKNIQQNLDIFKENLKNIEDRSIKLSKMEIMSSEYGGKRSLSCIRINKKNNVYVTSSWSGEINVWNNVNNNKILNLGNEDNIQIFNIALHPNCDINNDNNNKNVNIASGDCVGNIKLWGLENNNRNGYITTLEGHLQRIGCLEFHPLGNYLGSVSFDETFRFWDIEKGNELLVQEGHFKPIHSLSFQYDGSLCVTGDSVGVGKVWDIRSGKSIFNLIGHLDCIVKCDCSKNGYYVGTCSKDNTSKIWDLRNMKCLYTLPGHLDLISDIRFSPVDGEFLITSSFDKSIKIWSIKNFKCLSTLKGHENKITSCDFSPDENVIVSCGLDKTWKKWQVC